MRLRHVLAVVPLLVVLCVAPASASHSYARWPVAQVVLSDRTGDAGWQVAGQRAVGAWAAVGAGVAISWSEGGVGCSVQPPVVALCREHLRPGWMAVTRESSFAGRLGAASIAVDDRSFDQASMDHIVCHELGHALGLLHSPYPTSCLHPGSWATGPDAHDADQLRALYG